MVRLGALALAAGVSASPVAAEIASARFQSQALCGPAAEVRAWLPDKFAEAVTGGGLTESGEFTTLWTNPDTGTWSVTLAHPDGWTCVIAAGRDGWEAVVPATGTPG
jgi:hypothetical protein